jgi:uncharacterized protein involved in outer membrane biogenesis
LTFDNDGYRSLAIRVVKLTTGYEMAIDGPFSLELSENPSLSAEKIRFLPGPDENLPSVQKIGKFKIQVALKSILSGNLDIKELVAEEVAIVSFVGKNTRSDVRRLLARRFSSDMEIPIIEKARLSHIQLDMINKSTGRAVAISLQQLDIDDIRDTGPVYVKGRGTVNGNEFNLDGQLGSLATLIDGSGPFPIDVNMETAGFKLSAAGTINKPLTGEGLKLFLSGEVKELSHLFTLSDVEIPQLGHLEFKTSVVNDFTAPGLSKLQIKLAGDPQVQLAIEGSIENLLKKGSALQIKEVLTNPTVITLPAKEANRIYGAILMPYAFLSGRVLGKLVALIRNDKDASACILKE